MAMSQDEILDIVISELVEKNLNELSSTEKSHQPDLYEEVRKLSGEVTKIIAQLSEESRKTVERYMDQKDRLTGMESEYLYLQGAKDCVTLLKYLKVI